MESHQAAPWELYPALSPERLRVVATVFRDVRHEVALRAEPSKGDSEWSLACDAYQRTYFALAQAAAGPCREWLSVADEERQLVVGIGGIPVHFSRPERSPGGSRRSAQEEAGLLAAQLPLGLPAPAQSGGRWRIAVDADALGETRRVILVQQDTQAVPRYAWPIAFDGPRAASPIDNGKPVISVPPLEIRVRQHRERGGEVQRGRI